MASETTLSCFFGHRPAKPCFHRLWHRMGMNDGEIETLGFLIVADPTFEEHAVVPKDVSLASLALAKTVKDGFRNRVDSISNCVDAATSVPHNVIGIRAVSKTHSRVCLQNLTVGSWLQRSPHQVGRSLRSLAGVALRADAASHKTNTSQLASGPPPGQSPVLILTAW